MRPGKLFLKNQITTITTQTKKEQALLVNYSDFQSYIYLFVYFHVQFSTTTTKYETYREKEESMNWGKKVIKKGSLMRVIY